MKVKLGINGFGRIGRLVMRASLEREDVDVLAINDPFIDVEYMKYMLTYDTIHGKYNADIQVEGNDLVINGKTVKVFIFNSETDITPLVVNKEKSFNWFYKQLNKNN